MLIIFLRVLVLKVILAVVFTPGVAATVTGFAVYGGNSCFVSDVCCGRGGDIISSCGGDSDKINGNWGGSKDGSCGRQIVALVISGSCGDVKVVTVAAEVESEE